MYNILKNKIYSYFYYNFVKRFFEQVSETDNEEVYYRENKLVVLVKNEEIGERIYGIIKALKDRKDIICAHNITFKIDKYIIDEQSRVQLFSIDCNLEGEWDKFSKIEKLQELVAFAKDMQSKGYVLDDSKFENEKCSSISCFLSFFVLNDGKVEDSNGCIIKYIHYILSNGGNLEEFYQKIVSNNQICNIYEFPYALPVITMCYNYFVTGKVPENIYDILQRERDDEDYDNYYDDYLIANISSFESNFKTIENNDEYTIYDGNIKIYHNISSEFEKFFRDNNKLFINRKQSIELIDRIIIDFNGSIIGYKFKAKEIQDMHTIFDKKFVSQRELLDFIFEMNTYLFKVIKMLCYSYKAKDVFNIEKSLICIGDSNITFKITNIKELFNLAITNRHCLNKQIITIFFKLYMEYLNQIYGEMYDEEQFLDKIEVRCLSPILAKEFINYALKKEVNYEITIEEFTKFFYSTRTHANKEFSCDSRFEYNPLITPFFFDYEVEKKYGIKIQKRMKEQLADGRILITFKRRKKISEVNNKKKSLRKEILQKLGDIEDVHVNLVGISEIIYSKDINTDGMYNAVGYITEPIKGRQLTDEVLLSLTNKDFLKVAGYVFTKFARYYIPCNTIWMDDDFMFYINILDENFQIQECEGSKSDVSFMNWITSYLIEKGYNSNAFIDLIFSQEHCSLKSYLLDLANSFDAYCAEHDIYYNSAYGMCPVCIKTKYLVPQNFERSLSKIFEDLYAKHYRIDSHYNLKVYKTPVIDLVEVEENIDKIISMRLNSKELKLGQDCFVPYKKALDRGDHFIGYIYDAAQFNNNETGINVCDDIKNFEKLKNLPRLMSLIRLILQIKEITTNHLSFINNPFSYVFLSKSHKKQVQILNIEFLSEKGNVKDTIKWACEYICEILNSDPSIEVDVSDCTTDLDSILEKLQVLSKDMTKYCAIHKMYYRSNYLFCPKCINKKQMEHIEVKEVKESKITEQKLENEGGESFIYSYDNDSVAKVFKEEINYDLKSIVIAHVLGKKEILEGINNKNLKYKYIIPQKLLVDTEAHKIFGYIMKKVSGIPFSSLRDKTEVEKLGLTKQDVFEILITVGRGIETLHANNIYIGDLNGRNILFDTQKNVYFLDFDGMGVDNIAPEFCTDGYIDPISKKNQNITAKDDWYSFAVQAFYYLTFTHPFNGIYSVKENNEERILDIPDKMERRISLLGNHGMKPPTIAESWDWMNEELIIAFLNIFEGESRESIVPHLVVQYENLSNNNQSDIKSSVRINPKFIATELNPFRREVVRIINHYAAVCKKEDGYYVSILVNNNDEKIIYFLEYMDIQNVLLTGDEKIAFVIYKNKVITIDLKTNSQIYTKEILDSKNVVVNGNTLYFTGVSEEGNIIFQIDFTSKSDVKEQKIKFLVNQETKRFYAKFNSKFILVKHSLDNTVDQIYCNSRNLCDMSYSCENTKYNIIYDDISDSWLVVSSEGNGIIIRGNGTFKTFNIQESINDINVENLSFNKGIIYIPNQDSLHIININDQTTTKKMECYKIMTPNSKLYDICTNGFSVITDNMLYEVRRG